MSNEISKTEEVKKWILKVSIGYLVCCGLVAVADFAPHGDSYYYPTVDQVEQRNYRKAKADQQNKTQDSWQRAMRQAEATER